MSNLEFACTAARVTFTIVGLIVMLMWVASCIGLGDFRLTFEVSHANPKSIVILTV